MRRILTSLLLVLPTFAVAQERCDRALVQDRAVIDVHDVASLATLKLLQKSSSSTSDLGISLKVPIKGLPVGATLNDATTAASDYFEKSTLNWDTEHLQSVATQTLSSTAAEAYKACIQGTKRFGTTIIVHNATRNSLAITVRWVAGPKAPTSASAKIFIQGGKALNGFLHEYGNNDSYSTSIRRQPGADFRIVANIGGDSDDQLVAAIPDIMPPETVKAGRQLYYGLTPGINAGEISDSPAFKGGTNLIYGLAVQQGPQSGDALFIGMRLNVNAGSINTSPGSWRGGPTGPFGFVIAPGKQGPHDAPLYVGIDPRCAGMVTSDADHDHCRTKLFGYALVP